ncbi:TPA: apolipoprotein A1/A4/E family protein [Aeromonas bestiarum]|nr:apolipoprotein A1/A4/E family protein [Aeromonas bestiarum]
MSATSYTLNTPFELSLRNDTDLSLVVVLVASLEHGGLVLGPDSKRLALGDGSLVLAPRVQARVALPAGPQGIILADATSLFPVASGVFDLEANPGQQLALCQVQVAALGQALNLVRNLMAAPSSQLASDLIDNLQASLKKPGTDADAILRGFLDSHPPFQPIDVSQFGLALSWARNYAYLWSMAIDGSPGQDYDLQASPYLGVATDSLGRISFRRKAVTTTADPSDPTCGLQLQWTPSGGSATRMNYNNGCLSDGVALTLIGSFVAAGWVSGPAAAGLLPVLVGSLNGQRVIAVPSNTGVGSSIVAPTGVTTPAESTQSLDVLDISNLTMSLIGLVSSVVTIVSAVIAVVGYFKARRAANQPIDRGAVSDAQTVAQEVSEALRGKLREELAAVLASLPMLDDLQQMVQRLRDSIPEILKKVVCEQLGEILNQLQEQVRELGAIEITSRLQEVQGNLVEARASLSDDLSRATQELLQAHQEIPQVISEMGALVSRQLGEQIESALEVTRETLKVSEQVQEDMEDVREGKEDVVEVKSPVE